MIQGNYRMLHKLLIIVGCLYLNSLQAGTNTPAKSLRTSRLSSHGQLGTASAQPVQPKTTIVPVAPAAKAPTQMAPVVANQIAASQGTVMPGAIINQDEKSAPATAPEPQPDIASGSAPQLPVSEKEEEGVVFNFENADLQNFINYIAEIFHVTFITDDAINPILSTGKAAAGNKISFKTQVPLSRKQAWSLFVTFLDMANLSLYQEGKTNIYRISTIAKVQKSPIPTFIGVNPSELPDNDTKIRYIYFLENTALDAIKGIVEALRGKDSSLTIMQELKAFMITDSAYNIKTLMKIVKELDRVNMPQAMSVVRLKWVDAAQVKKLYDSLAQPEGSQPAGARVFGPRKQSAQYFPEDARIITEPRTNTLILLGSQEAITKIEQFVLKYIDVQVTAPYSPLHTHQLKYAQAETVAAIMNNVVKFGKDTEAGKAGGIRGEDKYLRNMSFTAESAGNRLIIRGEYDDYLKARAIIEQLDEAQPQVAIEVLILSVDMNNQKEFGAQIRNKWTYGPDGVTPIPSGPNGLLGNNVSFQTSGLRAGGSPQGVVTNSGATVGSQKLLGDLINLVVGKGAGNTVVTLGTDPFGVWGIFQALYAISNAQVVSNPFLIVSNKTPAKVSLGETRRVLTANVTSATATVPTYGDSDANLTVDIVPQINSDGMIVLALKVVLDQFTSSPTDATNGNKTTKTVDTWATVADKEVIALGGLIKNTIIDNVTKVPILGDIPLFGWLFKNKRKQELKSNLIILVSARIIDPIATEKNNTFTQNHINDYKANVAEMGAVNNTRDLVDRTFFKESFASKIVDQFIFKESEKKNAKLKGKKLSRKEKRQQRQQTREQQLNAMEPKPTVELAQNTQPYPTASAPLEATTTIAAPQFTAPAMPEFAPEPAKISARLPKKQNKNVSLVNFTNDQKTDGVA